MVTPCSVSVTGFASVAGGAGGCLVVVAQAATNARRRSERVLRMDILRLVDWRRILAELIGIAVGR